VPWKRMARVSFRDPEARRSGSLVPCKGAARDKASAKAGSSRTRPAAEAKP
jgi:hypothetical protein